MLMPTHANLIIWCDSQALILNWVKNEKNVFYKLYDKLVMLQYDILFKSLQPERVLIVITTKIFLKKIIMDSGVI